MAKKLFNAELFFLENGIVTHTSGYRQCRPGWVQTECPYCHGYPHLGYHKNKGYFNCYSCGWHPIKDTLTKFGFTNFGQLLERYSGHFMLSDEEYEIERASICKLPRHSSEPTNAHIKYLKSRGFNWKRLQRDWDISFTNQVTKQGYEWRVLIPFYHKGQLVTYQARSINPESELRYRACPAQEEVIDVKQVLYGLDDAVSRTAVCVEGITDVWKLGPGAVGTQGIDFSEEQVQLLVSNFDNVLILFDSEKQAQKQAELLSMKLSMFEVDSEIVTLRDYGDPGELSRKEGRTLMKELLL